MEKMKIDQIEFIAQPTDEFLVSKKEGLVFFIAKEFFVFFLISLGSFFSMYISADNLNSEDKFSNALLLILNFYTFDNLIHTALGLFIVMGLISFINHLLTASYLNIHKILTRLFTSVIDFYYLMLSTVLGGFFALYVFVYKNPNIKDYVEYYDLAIKGIVIVGIVGSCTAVLLQFFLKINEIRHNN